MPRSLFYLLSVFLVLCQNAAQYLFLINRKTVLENETDGGDDKANEKNKKINFKYQKKEFIFFSVLFLLSVAVLFYSRIFKSESMMDSFIYSATMSWLGAIALIDRKEKIIPNSLVAAGIAAWVVYKAVSILIIGEYWKVSLLYSALGAFICGGVLLIISFLLKNALGLGDVKMFFVIGLFYGLQGTYSIMLVSILVMAVVSIVLLILKKVTRKTAIPMAPFVAVGFLIKVLLGF